MFIQVYSDIHLEFYKTFPKIERKAKYLILAGDIGRLCDTNYKEFIDYCSKTWEKTIVILGNHEFYHNKKTYEQLLKSYILFFSQYDNIELLEKDKTMLEDWEVIGLTMWSNILPKYSHLLNCVDKIKTTIYKNENKRKQGIGYEKLNELHYKSKEWLYNNYNKTKKTIIITHHPITHKNISQPMYEHEPIERKQAFATNLHFTNEKILVCISGHTHFSHDFIDNNIRYISNQMGYKEEMITNITKFNESGQFHL